MTLSMDDCERRVDAMCKRANELLSQCESEFRISHVLGAFSGGDDSIVATHWAIERFPSAVAMNADTKIGLQPSRDHIAAVVNRFGWSCEIASPIPGGKPKGWVGEWIDAETSYEEFVLNFGFPGPQQHPRMCQRLKQRCFRQVRKRLGDRPRGSRVLVVSGIRHDESAIRAGYKRSYKEEPGECFVWFNPFYESTAVDFEAYRQWHGLPRNPVKARCGISGECCCGAFAAPGERLAYEEVDPAFSEYLDNLEKRVRERFPWGWESGPPQWWIDKQRGQQFLFDPGPTFMPACVGCNRKQMIGGGK